MTESDPSTFNSPEPHEAPLIDGDTTIKLIMRGMGDVVRPRRLVRDIRAISDGVLPWES